MDFFQILNEWAVNMPGGETLYTIFIFIIVLGVLVFVHEWGHYAAAKSVGITIEEFSIGFGPAIARWRDSAKTYWKIGIMPLGGYVQMKGQEDGKPTEQKDLDDLDKDSFGAKSLWQRSWVVFAGPFANFVLAFVVLSGLMMWGEQKLLPQVGNVQEEMPAAEAGLREKDIIRVVNDVAVDDWMHLQKLTSASAEKELQLVVEREGSLFPMVIVPKTTTFTDLLGDTHTVGRIGIGPSGKRFSVSHGVFGGMWRGIEKTWELTSLTFVSLYKLLIGAVSADNLAGPLGIADMAGSSAAMGTYSLLLFLAIISVNLGIVNLLPIPVLDGGHLVFFIIEGIKGSPISEKIQMWSLRAGLSFILCLIIFATGNDIKRMDVFGTVSGWVTGESGEVEKTVAE